MEYTIGAHVDQDDFVDQARASQVRAVQIFLGDPQSYKGPAISFEGGAAGLRAAAEEAGLRVYVHSPYIVNVASLNNRIRIPSRKLLQQFVDAAAEIGASGLIVHGGSVAPGADVDDDALEKGFDNWRKAVEATDLKVPVLVENTAGGAGSVARTVEHIERLWAAIGKAEGSDMVGFCLDTCHAHAGGIALATAVEQVRAITGRIDLVHLNDSRDVFDSGADRHAALGAGRADPDGLVTVVREAAAPAILETPGGASERSDDVAWITSRL